MNTADQISVEEGVDVRGVLYMSRNGIVGQYQFHSICCECVLLPTIVYKWFGLWKSTIEQGKNSKQGSRRKQAESKRYQVSAEGDRPWRTLLLSMYCDDT